MSVLRFDPFGDPFRQVDRLTNQLLSGTRTPMGMPMDVWRPRTGFMSRWTFPVWIRPVSTSPPSETS